MIVPEETLIEIGNKYPDMTEEEILDSVFESLKAKTVIDNIIKYIEIKNSINKLKKITFRGEKNDSPKRNRQ